jgi:hypothetical protein
MRKTIFTALVTLLVMLAVVSCDSSLTVPGAGKAEYTEDGERLVTLKVNTLGTAGNRSLTNGYAKDAADYMEVIFTKNGKYYRAGGSLTSLSVTIPTGTYDVTDAIMLIGRAKDKLLLATGELAASTPVTKTTPTIGFTVTSLNTNLALSGTTSFVIDESSGTPAINVISGKFTESGITKEGVWNGGTLDCFQVPTSTAGISASLTISGFKNTTAIVNVASGNKVEFTQEYGTTADISDPTGVTFAFGTGTPVPVGSGRISFNFTTSTVGGYKISFEIPVQGFGTAAKGLVWNICGGTKGGQDFVGSEENSVMLIVVAEPAPTLVTIPITDPVLPSAP